MKSLSLALLFSLAATAAFAGAPSNEDILLARSQADEAQLAFAQKVVARMQADDKALADYWAAYVAGLAPAKK